MKLTELEACFRRVEFFEDTWQQVVGDPATWRERGCPSEPVTGMRERYPAVDALADAQGIEFLCPLCFKVNGGNVGTHHVICWFAGRGVPDEVSPKPGRWNPSGTGIDDLTFIPPGAVSVQLLGGCNWHGYVSDGNAE